MIVSIRLSRSPSVSTSGRALPYQTILPGTPPKRMLTCLAQLPWIRRYRDAGRERLRAAQNSQMIQIKVISGGNAAGIGAFRDWVMGDKAVDACCASQFNGAFSQVIITATF
ncbi:MAG: hypothetical protein ACLRXQ_06125 [Phascolarctobacterium faecium]